MRARALRAPVFLGSLTRKTHRSIATLLGYVEKTPRKTPVWEKIHEKLSDFLIDYNNATSGGTVNLMVYQIRLKQRIRPSTVEELLYCIPSVPKSMFHRRNWVPQSFLRRRMCLPPWSQMGGEQHSLAGEGVRGPNLDDRIESLALCALIISPP